MRGIKPKWLRRMTRLLSAGHAQTPVPLLHTAELAELLAVARQMSQQAEARPAHWQINSGQGRSGFIGRGMDYAESRPYHPGDDVRSMHWTLLARTGKPHVKLHHEEHAAAWHVLLDLRPAMAFGTRVRTKAQQAARAAILAAAAQALRLPQSTLSATLWTPSGWSTHALGCGLQAVRRLGVVLSRQPLPLPGGAAPGLAQDGRAFAAASRLVVPVQRGALRVVISDFAWLDETSAAAVRRLGADGQLRAVQIRDSAEAALPDFVSRAEGAWFYDAASGQTGKLAGPAQRQAFAAAARNAAHAISATLRDMNAAFVVVPTHDDAKTLWNHLHRPSATT
jgi:uncharacterized protein (DUF58 family)